MYKNLKRIIKNDKLVVVIGDTCVMIMNKADYLTKIQTMVDEEITNNVYTASDDNTFEWFEKLW